MVDPVKAHARAIQVILSPLIQVLRSKGILSSDDMNEIINAAQSTLEIASQRNPLDEEATFALKLVEIFSETMPR